MPIAAFFIIAKKWKQCKYSSTDVCTHKMWYGHTMEYYKANQNELIHTANWMNPENIMLSERRPQKATYCIILFT